LMTCVAQWKTHAATLRAAPREAARGRRQLQRRTFWGMNQGYLVMGRSAEMGRRGLVFFLLCLAETKSRKKARPDFNFPQE
jgi:hypothetical protein